MTDNEKLIEDDGRIRIWVNSGANMSRGKYAAAAVHAALTAARVHPGVPVVVLGGQRDHIERMQTVIHDAGRTEVEPGTATAGTDYVFEKAHTPTDDEREALIEVMRNAPTHGNVVVRYDEAAEAIIAAGFRRSEVPEPVFPDQSIAEAVEYMREAETLRTIPAQAQGEPSDGQVDAGAQALFNEMLRESSIGDVNGTFERCRDSARLVLRAAGGVR